MGSATCTTPELGDISELRVCTQLTDPQDISDGALPPTNTVSLPSSLDQGLPSELAMPRNTFWQNGKTLRICFVNGAGSSYVRSKVRQYAAAWLPYIGIKMLFLDRDTGLADIRIGFDTRSGSWSYIGTVCAEQAKGGGVTMNYGWFNDTTTDEEFSRTTIHEFGHALGCVHEHQSPAVNIPWNKSKIYEYFLRSQGWDKAKVDSNIFSVYPEDTTVFSDFDLKSIMLYFFPKEFTLDGSSTPSNTTLSDTDKAFISRVYPRRLLSHTTNIFSTSEIRNWDPPVDNNSKAIEFSSRFDSPPTITTGLKGLDIGCQDSFRFEVYADNINENGFKAHLDGTTLYQASCTWLETTSNESDLQVGTCNWTREPDTGEKKFSQNITFERTFERAPTVVIWLKNLDMDPSRNIRVHAYASDINPDSFTVNLETWADSIINSGGISWIAYPTSRNATYSGSVKSNRDRRSPQLINGGGVKFSKDCFTTVPNVLTAVNYLDFDNSRNVRFKATAENVDEQGMQWRADSWGDSIVYGIGVGFLAMA